MRVEEHWFAQGLSPVFSISRIQGDVLSAASRANSLRYLGDESFVGDAISQDQVSQEESQ